MLTLDVLIDAVLDLADALQGLILAPLQFVRDQAVLGIDGAVPVARRISARPGSA
jgi:hypothetical protein